MGSPRGQEGGIEEERDGETEGQRGDREKQRGGRCARGHPPWP